MTLCVLQLIWQTEVTTELTQSLQSHKMRKFNLIYITKIIFFRSIKWSLCKTLHVHFAYLPSCYTGSQNCEMRLLASSCLSVCLSVCPSVRMELGSHWTDFHETWYVSIFRKYVEKIQVSLKSGKNNGYFTWRPTYIHDNISPNSS